MTDLNYENLHSFEELLKGLKKDYGKELIKIGNDNTISGVEWWSLSSPKISDLFGKGFPKGRIVEIFGNEASGKTSLCYYLAGQIQKQGGNVAYIDTEMALDRNYAEQMGVDLNKLLIIQPDYGEQALDIALDMSKSGQIQLIIIDSIAALSPKAEIEGSMEDNTIGLMARNNSQFLRKVTGILKRSSVTLIGVNQNREKIGVLFGNPITQPGGKAWKFYSSIRVEVYKKETLIEKDSPYGIISRLKLVKNKVGCPYRDTEVNLIFGKGYDVESEWVGFAVNENIIKKGGAWYTLENGEKFQGQENLVKWLKDNKEYYQKEIIDKIKKIKFDSIKKKEIGDTKDNKKNK